VWLKKIERKEAAMVRQLFNHFEHETHTAERCDRDVWEGLVVVSAFHRTKGKEGAAFAMAWLVFLPPLQLPS
jgi:hypothetical protein